MAKFVSAQKPPDHADRLHEVQREIALLEAKLKVLESEEKHLTNYLVRFSKHEPFNYNSKDGYKKVVKIAAHSRMILDQPRVRKLLKNRTPYTESTWQTCKVDWVYE